MGVYATDTQVARLTPVMISYMLMCFQASQQKQKTENMKCDVSSIAL